MTNPFWNDLCHGVFGKEVAPPDVQSGERSQSQGHWPAYYRVSDFAEATIGLAAVAASRLFGGQPVSVNRRRASLWFDMTLRPEGWQAPSIWGAIAGEYASKDGWIRLHTNAPHHETAVLAILGVPAQKQAVADAVAEWGGDDLETAVVAAGGCAAFLRSPEDWQSHEQGRAVAREPLVHWHDHGACAPMALPCAGTLKGIKVLDLTRVLAGPVATRFLAGWGAEVLRIDPPFWNEAGVEMEVNLGKRCAGLDLRLSEDRAQLLELMRQADVFVHGYRADALERLGLGDAIRRKVNPALIDVRLNAYGWSGPWTTRRGFDTLVQMSCGIAHRGMEQSGGDVPVRLPVQALDHATGYLMATCVLDALRARCEGQVRSAKVSLARSAHLLMQHPCVIEKQGAITLSETDFAPEIEHTSWGPAHRVYPPVRLGASMPEWRNGARAVRSHESAGFEDFEQAT